MTMARTSMLSAAFFWSSIRFSFICVWASTAFVPFTKPTNHRHDSFHLLSDSQSRRRQNLQAVKIDGAEQEDSKISACRRDFIHSVGCLSAVALTTSVQADSVGAATSDASSGDVKPVAVIGAGGRTGMEVAQELARNGIPAVTLTRSGKDPFQVVKLKPALVEYIQHYAEPASVTDESLDQALKSIKPSAIIYCASASRQGGTAFQVDDEGVGRAAALAKQLKSKFVLISALAVDRPESKSFKVTNSLGGNYDGIMDAKRQGEEKVRQILDDYVIIRPGALMNVKSKNGAIDLELNQGDTIGGGISRDEVAGLAVGALKRSSKKGITVEAYRTVTHTALQPEFDKISGSELRGSTYAELFDLAKSD